MSGRLSRQVCSFIGIGLVGVSVVMSPLSNAADWKTIQQRGRLIVAVKENQRPLGFRDESGQLRGLEIDIAERLAQDLLGRAQAIELRPVSNQDRLAVVLNGQVDVAIARITATASRSRIVTFSLPYYLDGTALVTRDPGIRRPSDLTTQSIAVLNGSSTIATLRYRLPTAKLVGVESYQAARDLLEQGKVGAFAADATTLSGWVQEFPQYHLLPSTLSVEPLCIVLPKGLQYDELRRRINEILGRWESEGWLQDRIRYWGLPSSGISPAVP